MKGLIIFAIILLVLISSGCIGVKAPTGPSAEQSNAKDSISYAVERYNYYQDDYEEFSSAFELAKSRGVDTSELTSVNAQINSVFSMADENIKLANQYYSARQYSYADDAAQKTITLLDGLDSLLNQATALLKSAYDNTVAHYKERIQDSQKEIKIASAYIQDARNSGADVENLDKDLTDAPILLENAKRSFSNMELYKIDEYVGDIFAKTKKIQEEALYSKRYHLTSIAIDEVKKIIKTDAGNRIIDNATVEKDQGNFQKAIDLLNKALISDVFAKYKSNKINLVDFYQDNNIQLDTYPIDSLENNIESNINQRKYSEATELIPKYRENVDQALEASVKISNAKLALEALKGVTYLGMETNTTTATRSYTKATVELGNGRYPEAIADADLAIDESEKVRDNFYSQIETSIIKRVLSKILSLFGMGPPSIVFNTVDGVSLSWSTIPKTLINIDLSPPEIDIETGELESISSPIISLPSLETPQELKPVDFKLDIPEPTYSVSLFSGVSVKGQASIKNIGDKTAHNVRVRVELFSSDGKRIKLNGKDYIEKNVGDLRGGGTRSEKIEFSIGLGDGRNIESNGATSLYHIYSDEKNKEIEERFTV